MPVGTTIAITATAGLLLTASGFWLGRATAPDTAAPLVEAQTEQLDVLTDGMADLVSRANQPAVLSAELEADVAMGLLKMPPMCLPSMGGNPDSPACVLAWCIRTGETNKQRCEPSKLMDLYVADQDIEKRLTELTRWEQSLTLREAEVASCLEPER